MHKKATNEFDPGNGDFFPSSLVAVVFNGESYSSRVVADNAVVAYGNTMSVFAEIIDDRLSAIKSFFTVR